MISFHILGVKRYEDSMKNWKKILGTTLILAAAFSIGRITAQFCMLSSYLFTPNI